MKATYPISIKAVLFDCDGTLVDSEYAHYEGWKHALNHFGTGFTIEDYSQFIGKPAEAIAKTLAMRVGADCAEQLLKMKRKYYRNLCEAGLPPIPDAVNFLKTLALEREFLGIKLGLCSGAGKQEILSHLRHLEIGHLFDLMLSGQEDLHEYSDPEGVNKPKPYIYIHAMKMLGVSPHETVAIEDSFPGASAAVAAGCFTIAVPNIYTRQHDFSQTNWQLDSFSTMNIDKFLIKIRGHQSSTQLIEASDTAYRPD